MKHTKMFTAAAAAMALAAVLMTGCGGGGDKKAAAPAAAGVNSKVKGDVMVYTSIYPDILDKLCKPNVAKV